MLGLLTFIDGIGFIVMVILGLEAFHSATVMGYILAIVLVVVELTFVAITDIYVRNYVTDDEE